MIGPQMVLRCRVQSSSRTKPVGLEWQGDIVRANNLLLKVDMLPLCLTSLVMVRANKTKWKHHVRPQCRGCLFELVKSWESMITIIIIIITIIKMIKPPRLDQLLLIIFRAELQDSQVVWNLITLFHICCKKQQQKNRKKRCTYFPRY